MAIKVIAQRREVKLGKNPGKKFVMRPDLYSPIQEKKVFAEAATHSGISAGVIKAAWDAAGEVIRTWATEGHSVPLPGLGTMRFGVRSKHAALKLYARLGFVQLGVIPGGFLMKDGHYEDIIPHYHLL